MTDKEKIIDFLTLNGISRNSFYKKTGFSQGFLNSGSSIGVDKLKIIIQKYPSFNYKSLLFDEKYEHLADEHYNINNMQKEDINVAMLSLLKTIKAGIETLQADREAS